MMYDHKGIQPTHLSVKAPVPTVLQIGATDIRPDMTRYNMKLLPGGQML